MASEQEDTDIVVKEDKRSVDGESVDGTENDFRVIDENVDTLVSTIDTGKDNGQASENDRSDLLDKNHVCYSQDSGINSIENDPEAIPSTKDCTETSLGLSSPTETVDVHSERTVALDDSSGNVLSFSGSSQSLVNGDIVDVPTGEVIQTDDGVDISYQKDNNPGGAVGDGVKAFLTEGNDQEVKADPCEAREEKEESEKSQEMVKNGLSQILKPHGDSDHQQNDQLKDTDHSKEETNFTEQAFSINAEVTGSSQNLMEMKTHEKKTTDNGQTQANDLIRNTNEARVTDKYLQGDITRDTEYFTTGPSQTRKTNAGDQCGYQKRINSKRASNLIQIHNDLTEIDESDLDSPSLSHASGRKAHAQVGKYNTDRGLNTTTSPGSGGTVMSSKSRLGESKNNLSDKNVPNSIRATLITTPTERKCDSGTGKEESKHEYVCDGDKSGNNQIIDKFYNPYARATIRRHSIHSPSENGQEKTQRPSVSLFERPFTRHELRRALPRKSFFNSHDKVMKDAGFEADDPIAKRKAERLKARLDRIANEFNPLPSQRLQETGKEITEKPTTEVKIVVTDSLSENSSKSKVEETENNIKADASDETDGSSEKEILISNKDTGPIRPLMPSNRKKRPVSGRIEYVECKPLVNYLEYVKDNRQEYLQHLQTARTIPRDKPVARIIKMGRAFELRHQGGATRRKEDDVILLAAKALRPRTADPSKFYKAQRERGLWATDSAMKHIRPQSEDKRQQEKTTSTGTAMTTGTKEEDHPKSELEKRKLKAEDWSRSVTTQTLTRAKIQSLRELGSDDNELTKWWEAFKQCHYLRLKYG